MSATTTRQIAKTLVFPPEFAPFISWERIGQQRDELACDMNVRHDAKTGTVTITLFWDNSNGA